MAYFMYIALQDDDKVVVLEMDPQTGSLARKADAPIVGAPSALAISPDWQTLYIGHRNSNELSSHRINQTTGELTQVGKMPVDASPTYLATDRRGQYMLSAYYQGARVGVHAIGDDGALVAAPRGVESNGQGSPRDTVRPVQPVRLWCPTLPASRTT